MVGIISVVIGGHFGGGDHFDGGDHFGGCTVPGSSRGLTSQLTVSFINEPKQEPPSFKFAAVANDASGRIFTWQEIAQI